MPRKFFHNAYRASSSFSVAPHRFGDSLSFLFFFIDRLFSSLLYDCLSLIVFIISLTGELGRRLLPITYIDELSAFTAWGSLAHGFAIGYSAPHRH
jgi:hypothetical protein